MWEIGPSAEPERSTETFDCDAALSLQLVLRKQFCCSLPPPQFYSKEPTADSENLLAPAIPPRLLGWLNMANGGTIKKEKEKVSTSHHEEIIHFKMPWHHVCDEAGGCRINIGWFRFRFRFHFQGPSRYNVTTPGDLRLSRSKKGKYSHPIRG